MEFRADRVVNMSLPEPLASRLRPSTAVSTERCPDRVAIAAPIEHALYTAALHAPSATVAPLIGAVSEGEVRHEVPQSPGSNLVQTKLPPLYFKSQLNATTGARYANSIGLRQGGKPAHGILSDEIQERRSLTGRIRAFARLFLPVPVTPTIRKPAALSTPPPPYALFEKGTHDHTAQWEEKGHVAVQIKLPA